MDFLILYCEPCGYRDQADELVASKGGFWKRKLVHGAPPQSEILEAIARALEVREGDACTIPGAGQD